MDTNYTSDLKRKFNEYAKKGKGAGSSQDAMGLRPKSSFVWVITRGLFLSIIILPFIVIFIVIYAYFLLPHLQDVRIYNDSNEPIIIKAVKISNYRHRPQYSDYVPFSLQPGSEYSLVFSVQGSAKLELVLNDPIVSDKDFSVVCILPYDDTRVSDNLVWYREDSTLSCS